MLPYLSVDLVWLLRKQKQGDGFQGWHQDFSLGSRITKTIVVNVGSKETQNQYTPISFGDDFEAEEWEEVESYANSVFQNSEDELHVEPVAIHVKNAVGVYMQAMITSSDVQSTSSDVQSTSSDVRVTSSDVQSTSSDVQLTSSDVRVT
jgi:hypothetical protein